MANTRRMNRLEELGRVDAERADTRSGARNLAAEKRRIVGELRKKGGRAGYKHGGKVKSRGIAKKGFGKEVR